MLACMVCFVAENLPDRLGIARCAVRIVQLHGALQSIGSDAHPVVRGSALRQRRKNDVGRAQTCLEQVVNCLSNRHRITTSADIQARVGEAANNPPELTRDDHPTVSVRRKTSPEVAPV